MVHVDLRDLTYNLSHEGDQARLEKLGPSRHVSRSDETRVKDLIKEMRRVHAGGTLRKKEERNDEGRGTTIREGYRVKRVGELDTRDIRWYRYDSVDSECVFLCECIRVCSCEQKKRIVVRVRVNTVFCEEPDADTTRRSEEAPRYMYCTRHINIQSCRGTRTMDMAEKKRP